MKRFLLEGTWRGYRSSQDHVCHREVITETMAKKLEKAHCITFSDGTALILTVRPCKPREKVLTKHGYSSLIRDCLYADIWSVQGLVDARQPKQSV